VSSKKTLAAARVRANPTVTKQRGKKTAGNASTESGIARPKKIMRRKRGTKATNRLNRFEQIIETIKMYLGIGTCSKSLAFTRTVLRDIITLLEKKFQGSSAAKRKIA
jgi:hypothetical protein